MLGTATTSASAEAAAAKKKSSKSWRGAMAAASACFLLVGASLLSKKDRAQQWVVASPDERLAAGSPLKSLVLETSGVSNAQAGTDSPLLFCTESSLVSPSCENLAPDGWPSAEGVNTVALAAPFTNDKFEVCVCTNDAWRGRVTAGVLVDDSLVDGIDSAWRTWSTASEKLGVDNPESAVCHLYEITAAKTIIHLGTSLGNRGAFDCQEYNKIEIKSSTSSSSGTKDAVMFCKSGYGCVELVSSRFDRGETAVVPFSFSTSQDNTMALELLTDGERFTICLCGPDAWRSKVTHIHLKNLFTLTALDEYYTYSTEAESLGGTSAEQCHEFEVTWRHCLRTR